MGKGTFALRIARVVVGRKRGGEIEGGRGRIGRGREEGGGGRGGRGEYVVGEEVRGG